MNNKIVYSFLFVLLAFAGCKKDDIIGPNLQEMREPVVMVQPLRINGAASATVDFSADEEANITAKFDGDKSWIITITGQTSGAVKTYTGASDEVDITWKGSADIFPSFGNETCDIDLTFEYQADNFNVTANITSASLLARHPKAFLLSDMTTTTGTWSTDWPNYTAGTVAGITAAEGNDYLYITQIPWQGTPNVSPYVNFVQIPAGQTQSASSGYYTVPAQANDIFFNILVYNTAGTTDNPDGYGYFTIQFQEEGTAVNPEIEIRPDWTGWKLLSFNYKDEIGGTKPHRIERIQLTLLSSASQDVLNEYLTGGGVQVSMAVDYPVFTYGGPLQP